MSSSNAELTLPATVSVSEKTCDRGVALTSSSSSSSGAADDDDW